MIGLIVVVSKLARAPSYPPIDNFYDNFYPSIRNLAKKKRWRLLVRSAREIIINLVTK